MLTASSIVIFTGSALVSMGLVMAVVLLKDGVARLFDKTDHADKLAKSNDSIRA